jgi:hypothetical protein
MLNNLFEYITSTTPSKIPQCIRCWSQSSRGYFHLYRTAICLKNHYCTLTLTPSKQRQHHHHHPQMPCTHSTFPSPNPLSTTCKHVSVCNTQMYVSYSKTALLPHTSIYKTSAISGYTHTLST